MTNGWQALTSGDWRDSPTGRMAAAWLAIAALSFIDMAVNAASVSDELRRAGTQFRAWEPWVWEGTSAAGWLVVTPFIFLAVRKLRPPTLALAPGLACHCLLTVPVSLAHVGIMTGLREFAYRAAGATYSPDSPLGEILLYEYRKDAASYVLTALFFLLFEHVVRRQARGESKESVRIEIRDGSRVRWISPEEVDWAQAAGNYVELHGTFGSLLHRQTLAALEKELAAFGFARVHRSRLVRKAAVDGVETKPSGDFEIMLASGDRIGGSRRYRGGL